MLPVEVVTERLVLRQWLDEDAEPLAALYRKPGYLRHMPARDVAETREQIARFREAWGEVGYAHWVACDRETGRLVGRIGLLPQYDFPDPGGPVPEVGWTLDDDVWGRGLATEGGRVALEAWREHLPEQPRLYSFTVPENRRSRAVMERLGLAYGGVGVRRGLEHVWYHLDR